MDHDEIQHLKELWLIKLRRLRELEKKEAVQGVNVDPVITIEIENIKEEIREIRWKIPSRYRYPAREDGGFLKYTAREIEDLEEKYGRRRSMRRGEDDDDSPNYKVGEEEYNQQMRLLVMYRDKLIVLLKEHSRSGDFTHRSMLNDIDHAREEVEYIKDKLRRWGFVVEDEPFDDGIEDEYTIFEEPIQKTELVATPRIQEQPRTDREVEPSHRINTELKAFIYLIMAPGGLSAMVAIILNRLSNEHQISDQYALYVLLLAFTTFFIIMAVLFNKRKR